MWLLENFESVTHIIFLLDGAGVERLEFSSTDGPRLDRRDHPECASMDTSGLNEAGHAGLGWGVGRWVRERHEEGTRGRITQGVAGPDDGFVFP